MHSCWLRYKKQHGNWGEDLIVCESVTWEVWCCDLPSLTCSSVKVCLSVCLCTRFILDMMILSIRRQMCNKQTPALGTHNRKQKLQKLWRNSSDPFVGYYDRGRRESERAREREREKRRKRERRTSRKCLHCKKTTQTAHSWTLSFGSCSHLCQVHQLSVGYSPVIDRLTDWQTCWIISVNPVPNAQVKGEQHLPKHMG